MKFTIRSLKKSDIPAVLEIERASFPTPWAESTFKQELSNPVSKFKVAVSEDGIILGYYDVWLYAREGHLLNICVAAAYRRRGLGALLLGHAIKTARGVGTREVFLEVRSSNEPAKHLYSKFGFREIGLRKGYYRDGEDALVFVLILDEDG